MTEILAFLRDYSSLINTALILSLVGIGFKIFQSTIVQKNSEIDVLKERIAIQETFSITNVTEKFQALRDYYEKHLREWYESSMKTLEEEKRKAIESRESEFQKRIEEEIQKRNEIMAQYVETDIAKQMKSLPLNLEQVCGSYKVTGYNPQSPWATYFGDLQIEKAGEILKATWSISMLKQHHEGVGVMIGNVLGFAYVSDISHRIPGATQTGVVLYEFLTPEVLRGNWTSLEGLKMGLPKQLGFEECRRV